MRASAVSIRNLTDFTQKVWIFDSDGSVPESLALLPNTSGSFPFKNQHSYFMYSVGFGKIGEWNSSNPDEQLDPYELTSLLVDVSAFPRSDVRWDVVSWFPPEVIQGNDQCAPAMFTINTN